MRSRSLKLCAIALLCTFATVSLALNAEEVSRDDELTVIVYPVADLPVYLAPRGVEAQFQPALLVSLLKAELGPGHWQDERDSINPHEKSSALVIRTTRSNHKRLSTIIESLRRKLRPANAAVEATAEFGPGGDLEPLRLQAN